jgi:hypothetical protein
LIITKTGYPFKFVQKKKIRNSLGHNFTHIFTFYSSKNGLKYVVNIEEYEEELYAIKFYPKCLKRSEFKYNKIINKGDVINVLMTCASVIPYILKENKNASFGFVGSRTINSTNKFVESFNENKRYRIYSDLIKQVIGDQTFVHIEYEKISGYLLVNKRFGPISAKERKIKDVLNEIYTFVEQLQ